jgi:excisionase family DNA binding protein
MKKVFEPPTVSTPAGALSRKDAATYLSCSTRYLDLLAKRGELRRAKIGAKTVFLLTELDRFLQSKMQESV